MSREVENTSTQLIKIMANGIHKIRFGCLTIINTKTVINTGTIINTKTAITSKINTKI